MGKLIHLLYIYEYTVVSQLNIALGQLTHLKNFLDSDNGQYYIAHELTLAGDSKLDVYIKTEHI